MRTILIIILLVHGLIHLLGFVKAFNLSATDVLNREISEPAGLLWLLTCILFMWTAGGYLLKKEWWPVVAFIAVGFSQILIILNWEDAKYGTVANLLIFLFTLFFYNQMRFKETMAKETSSLFYRISLYDSSSNKFPDNASVPPVIERWMQRSGVRQNYRIKSLRLKQQGQMRMSPDGRWMSFDAVQYFDVQDPAFIWITKVHPLPFIALDGRDKLFNGEGEILIKAASIIKLADQRGNEKINSGSMLRFLAEMCWFPAAAKNPYISWKAKGQHAARATFKYGEKEVSGIFTFSATGDVISFEAFRYKSNTKNAKKELWSIKIPEHKTFDGLRVPARCKVTWKLAKGDFNWLNLEITDLAYNKTAPYGTDHLPNSMKVIPRVNSPVL